MKPAKSLLFSTPRKKRISSTAIDFTLNCRPQCRQGFQQSIEHLLCRRHPITPRTSPGSRRCCLSSTIMRSYAPCPAPPHATCICRYPVSPAGCLPADLFPPNPASPSAPFFQRCALIHPGPVASITAGVRQRSYGSEWPTRWPRLTEEPLCQSITFPRKRTEGIQGHAVRGRPARCCAACLAVTPPMP